ncbi:hemocyanin, beta-C chain unit D-like isoform X1 [Ciona intestinalis]
MTYYQFYFIVALMVSLFAVSSQKAQSFLTAGTFTSARKHKQSDVIDFELVPLKTALQSFLFNHCIDGGSCLTTKCAHGKIYNVSSGCCACTCRRGYIVALNRRSCVRARFGEWSTWSSCIVSEWGGVQHRERICKTKLGRYANNRCVGAGSQSRSCSEVTRDFRIRKNLLDLTDEELHDFIQGFTKFKQDHSLFGYLNTAKWHGWPHRCPWYKHGIEGHKNGHCSWHNHPMFLPWHRIYTVQFEIGLSRHMKNKTLGIPYWDWTDPSYKGIPNLVKNPTIYDPILKEYVPNPFYRTYIPSHAKVNNQTLYNFRLLEKVGYTKKHLMLRNIIQALNMPYYKKFDDTSVFSHDQIHNCVCKSPNKVGVDCSYSMDTTDFSAFDAMFFLHHSQMDRLYALFGHLRELLGQQDWTKYSFLQPYKNSYDYDFDKQPDVSGSWDWPMSPFCNASMNPSYVTLNKNSWTVGNSYYYQELFGYKYDTFDLARRDWKLLLKDLERSFNSNNFGHSTPFISELGVDLGVIYKTTKKFKAGCTT